MKRIIKCLLLITSIIILSYGVFLLFVPIARSQQHVRQFLLNIIPIGTKWNDAIDIIDRKKEWVLEAAYIDAGVSLNTKTGQCWIDDTKHEFVDNFGTQSMRIYIGEYYFPLSHVVKAYLAFDDEGNLIEILVQKEIDSL